MMKNPLLLFGILSIALAVVQILLCFMGPMAFEQKPSLAVFPLLVPQGDFSREEIRRVELYFEEEFARTHSFAIAESRAIAEYIEKNSKEYGGIAGDVFEEGTLDYFGALALAKSLGLARFTIGMLSKTPDNRMAVSIGIFKTTDGTEIRRLKTTWPDMDSLVAGIDAEGNIFSISDYFKMEFKTYTATDFLVLSLFLGQAAFGAWVIRRRKINPVMLEIIWTAAFMLFLFSLLYAQNANMDYVQRFIAMRGQIHLAENTAAEQLLATARYAPILLLHGLFYVMLRLGRAGISVVQPGESAPPSISVSWMDRLVRHAVRWALPAVLVSAILYGLAFPSFLSLDGMPILAWIALAPLFLVLLQSRFLHGVFYTMAWGVLQGFVINFWHSTYKYTALYFISSLMLVDFLLIGCAVMLAIRYSGKWGFLSVPLVWTFFEYVRGIGLLGYPWGLAGSSQLGFIPLIQTAGITGVWGISFIIILANAGLSWFMAAGIRGFQWNFLRRFSRLFPVAVSLLVVLIAVAYGIISVAIYDAEIKAAGPGQSARLVLVQQNTDPRKHDYGLSYERLTRLTDKAMMDSSSVPDLVVWSEGAFKANIQYWTRPDNAEEFLGSLSREFMDYQKKLNTWIVYGSEDMSLTEDGKPDEYFNASFLINPDGDITGSYHKIHLVPFTEYFPLDREAFGWFYAMLEKFDISDWTPGAVRTVFKHPRFRFITPICFEDAFPDDIRRFILEDVDIIVNISNDYWSLSPVEGRQHGVIGLLRAVENRRPMVRATSSGYTVACDAAGRIMPGSPEAYTEGYQVVDLPLGSREITLYTLWGDWFPWICLALGIITILLLQFRLKRYR